MVWKERWEGMRCPSCKLWLLFFSSLLCIQDEPGGDLGGCRAQNRCKQDSQSGEDMGWLVLWPQGQSLESHSLCFSFLTCNRGHNNTHHTELFQTLSWVSERRSKHQTLPKCWLPSLFPSASLYSTPYKHYSFPCAKIGGKLGTTAHESNHIRPESSSAPRHLLYVALLTTQCTW